MAGNTPERLEQGLGELYQWFMETMAPPTQYQVEPGVFAPAVNSGNPMALIAEAMAQEQHPMAQMVPGVPDGEGTGQMMTSADVEARAQQEAAAVREQIRQAASSGRNAFVMRGNEMVDPSSLDMTTKSFSRAAPGSSQRKSLNQDDGLLAITDYLKQRGFDEMDAYSTARKIRSGSSEGVDAEMTSRSRDLATRSSTALQQLFMKMITDMAEKDPTSAAHFLSQMMK